MIDVFMEKEIEIERKTDRISAKVFYQSFKTHIKRKVKNIENGVPAQKV